MKNILYFIILHLGAMVASYFIGGFFNAFVFVPNYAIDLVIWSPDETPSIFRVIGDYSFWESLWQLLIFVAFSYLINSALKTLSNWTWVSIVSFCTIILFAFSYSAFDFGLSKSFPDLGYESEQIARILFFLSLYFLGTGVGYLLAKKVDKNK